MDLIEAIIGGLVVAAVSGLFGYWIKRRTSYVRPVDLSRLRGTPLSSTPYYPVEITGDGRLRIDKERFLAGIVAFIQRRNPKAASDLIYFGEANLPALELTQPEAEKFSQLKKKYRRNAYGIQEARERKSMFDRYREIVHGIGETFQGLPIEIVLHDTRDPLHSVVSIRNPVTGRKVDDPNTDFGVRLIRSYERHGSLGNQVGYRLTASDGREFKSTTIPIVHHVFGLIAFICLNIDIARIAPESKADMTVILQQLTSTPLGSGDEVLLADVAEQ